MSSSEPRIFRAGEPRSGVATSPRNLQPIPGQAMRPVIQGRPVRDASVPPPVSLDMTPSGWRETPAIVVEDANALEYKQILQEAAAAGRDAAFAEARAEMEPALRSAAAIAAGLEAAVPHDANAIGHAVVQIAMAVARRVVARELGDDPAILVRAVETAARSLDTSPTVRVLLHPDGAAVVRETWEALHGLAYLGKTWTFEPDASLPPGGCVVHCGHGFVDAGLEAQLDEIGRALDAAVPGLARDLRAAGGTR